MKPNYEKYLELSTEYFRYELGHTEKTIKTYHSRIKLFFEWLTIKEIPTIRSITSEHLSEYLSELKKEGMSATSINLSKNSVSALFKYLIDKKKVNKNIAESVKAQKVPHKVPVIIQKEDLIKLLELTNNCIGKDGNYLFRDEIARMRVKLAFRVLIFSGLRVGELVNLKIEDISKGVIFVRDGKGQKDRLVPIADKANTIITELIDEYLELRKEKKISSEYLFVNYSGDKISETTMQGDMKKLFVEIDRKYLSTHKTRSTFATNVLKGNKDIKRVAELLGHTTTAPTEKYLLVDTDMKKEAVESMPMLDLI